MKVKVHKQRCHQTALDCPAEVPFKAYPVERIVMAGILFLGIVIRLWQFAFNRSLWLDEAYLATSFLDRGTWGLLTEPLANGQAAPLGFLLAAKFIFSVLGGADWTLRVLPLMSGLATLLGAWLVSMNVWRQPLARIVFVGLAAFSPVLIYYASEFKQYGGDVLVTMLLVWACVTFSVEDLRASLVRLAWIGVLGVWLSHPSVFVLAAVGLILCVECGVRRQWRGVAGLAVIGALWLSSFGLHYFLGLKAMAANPHLTRFWTMAYAPMPPFEVGDAAWFWENGLGLVYLAFRHVGIAHHLALPGWTGDSTVALGAWVLAGWLVAWRLSWRWTAILMLPVLVTLVASGLHLYPFRSRLILFLVPLIWMALVTALEVAMNNGQAWTRSANVVWRKTVTGLSAVLALMLMLVVLRPTAQHVLAPYNGADIKSAMAYMQARRLPGDHLIINAWSNKAFAFYQDAFDLGDVPTYIYRQTPNVLHDAFSTAKRVCRAGETGRTWLLLSHRFEARHAMLRTIQSIAPVMEQWEGDGAGAYVLNIADTPFCADYRDAPE